MHRDDKKPNGGGVLVSFAWCCRDERISSSKLRSKTKGDRDRTILARELTANIKAALQERDVALERAAEIKEDGDACVKALEVETNEAKMEKDQAEHHRLEREREMRKIFEHLCERRDALLKEAEDLERPGWLNFFCLCGSGPHKKGMLHTLSAASLPYFSSGVADPTTEPNNTELVNALIATKWKFISQWFRQTMKSSAEPLLQDLLAAYIPGIRVAIGDICGLGSTPVCLRNIRTETHRERLPGEDEDIENLQIVGFLDYVGGVIDLDFTLIGGELGKMTADAIQIRGDIVIELVKLSREPPWFSGIRVYFPDTPTVDLSVHSKVVGLVSVGMARFKDTLVEVLRDKVIAPMSVLPNRICVGIGHSMEDAKLRHWQPEGVLRIAMIRGQGFSNPCDPKWYMPLRSTWVEKKVAPFVELSLGSAKSRTTTTGKTLNPVWEKEDGSEEVHDFLVVDQAKQNVQIAVRNRTTAEILGCADLSVTKIIENPHIKERWLPLESKGGSVCLKAQWRPFAPEGDRDAIHLPNYWGLGGAVSNSVQLIVDVFHIAGLLPAEDGTEHWFTISVINKTAGTTETLHERESSTQPAHDSVVHGHGLLKQLGITSKALGPEAMSAVEWAQLSRGIWRSKVEVSDAAAEQEKSHGKKLTDVLWDSTFCFPLDMVSNKTIQVTVWRPAKGKTRQVGRERIAQKMLGTAEIGLDKFLSQNLVSLPLLLGEKQNDDCAAQVKMRVRVCPLLEAPAAPPTESIATRALAQLGDAVGLCAQQLCSSSKDAGSVDPVSFEPESEAKPEVSKEGAAVDEEILPTGSWWNRMWGKLVGGASEPKASEDVNTAESSDVVEPVVVQSEPLEDPVSVPARGSISSLSRVHTAPCLDSFNDEDQGAASITVAEDEADLTISLNPQPSPSFWSRWFRRAATTTYKTSSSLQLGDLDVRYRKESPSPRFPKRPSDNWHPHVNGPGILWDSGDKKEDDGSFPREIQAKSPRMSAPTYSSSSTRASHTRQWSRWARKPGGSLSQEDISVDNLQRTPSSSSMESQPEEAPETTQYRLTLPLENSEENPITEALPESAHTQPNRSFLSRIFRTVSRIEVTSPRAETDPGSGDVDTRSALADVSCGSAVEVNTEMSKSSDVSKSSWWWPFGRKSTKGVTTPVLVEQPVSEPAPEPDSRS